MGSSYLHEGKQDSEGQKWAKGGQSKKEKGALPSVAWERVRK